VRWQDLIATGRDVLYTSRRKLWKKERDSVHVQRVVEMRVDCDQDAIWRAVEQAVARRRHSRTG